MGMAEAEFWECPPRYFMRRRKAYLQNRNGMEEARFISFWVMKAAGAKIRRVTQLAKFPWDVVQRTVKLEAWDSPEMLKFDREADEALRILNPEAYEAYMEGKRQRELAATAESGADLKSPPDYDPDMTIEAELDF